jgi:hypothetical protein
MSSSSRADEILAKFPRPVALKASRTKWILVLIGCGVFTAGGIAMVLNAAPWAWFVLIVFGLGTMVAAAMLLPGAGALQLDRDGFETTSLFRRRRSRWQDTSGFEPASIPPSMVRLVVYDDVTVSGKSFAKFNIAVSGRNAGLPDTYGLAAADLARLMTRWRERVLSQASS